jgi:hypothetical protein
MYSRRIASSMPTGCSVGARAPVSITPLSKISSAQHDAIVAQQMAAAMAAFAMRRAAITRMLCSTARFDEAH